MARKGKYTKKVTLATHAKRHVRRHWSWFSRLSRKKKIAVIAAPFIAFLVLTPLLTYAYFAHDISDEERLMNRNNTGIVLLDKNGTPFYNVGRAEHRKIVPLKDIATNTQKALLASEDKDFYKHGGFSPGSILRALYGDIISGSATAYGGSTLTQQLAKNTLLTNSQTFLRKYQELAVSIAIEQQYSKDQILDMYLNSVYFGDNAFGIEDAAKVYFNKLPKDLTVAESAMLIGVLPAPSAYSPISGDIKLAKERQNTVLSRMVTNGFISEDGKKAALAQQLVYAKPVDTNDSDAPHFAQMVLQALYDKYGEEKVTRSGYQVTTTLDLTMQKRLNANVADHLPYIQANGGTNVGAIAIDPTSGEIRGLVGSADWHNPDWGKVNMAITPRQPGSSFKPIYYSRALADGVITPATILQDIPTDFGGGYRPLDADRSFRGDVTVRTAINESLNIPSVEVMQKLGIKKAVETARAMGITTVDDKKDYGLSLALGSAEAPLEQMTNAYAAFANQGQQYPTTIIRSINDKFNSTIFKSKQTSKPVISSAGAYLISDILSDNKARAPIFGSSLSISRHTVAVKTGTTDNSRDAWTIGYTPSLAVGVWVGNNNNDTMLSGGSDMAGPIWAATMRQSLGSGADQPFIQPSDVIEKYVCYGTGALSSGSGYGTYYEKFLASALPTQTCSPQSPPKKVEAPKKEVTAPKETTTQPTSGNTAQTCPSGSTGTYPNCTTTAQTQPQTCPSGSTGTYPNCTCINGYAGTYPNCKAPAPSSTSP
jgi:1A family penicillin-binding protein